MAGRRRPRAAAARAQRAAGRRARPRPRLAARARRACGCWSAPALPDGRHARWRRPTPATSSAATRRASATAGRCCSASSSTPTAGCATCTSRARAARRSPAAATAWPRSARCCASTSSARRCTPSASPPPARSPSSRPGAPVQRETRAARRRARPGREQPPAGRQLPVRPRHRRPRPAAPPRRPRDRPPPPRRRRDAEHPYLALFEAVVAAQAALVAQWMLVGFVHGVMNTDNMTISGETIDYGPCAFMDAFDPATVFSSIDTGGRYAYGNQPVVAEWNLARLAEALLPLLARRPGRRRSPLAVESLGALPRPLLRGLVGGHARQARPARRTSTDDVAARWSTTCSRCCRPTTSTTRRSSAASAPRPAATPSPRAGLFLDLAGVRRLGRRAGAPLGPGRRRDGPGQPGLHPAQPPRRGGARRRDRRRPRPARAAARRGDAPFDERPGLERYAEPAPESTSARYQTFCGT